MLLAKTSRQEIDADLNYPLLQLVSEGNSTGRSYFELVFAPIKKEDIRNVLSVREIALRVSANTIEDWINKFNTQIEGRRNSNLRNYKLDILESVTTRNRYGITRNSSNAGINSIQANILIPVDTFANLNKIRTLFEGIEPGHFKAANVFDKLSQIQTLGGQPVTARMKAIAFISIYICYMYSIRDCNFGGNMNKTFFYILPKIELITLIKEIFHDDSSRDLFVNYINNITPKMFAFFQSRALDYFVNNMNILTRNITSANPISITPRESGVLPIYNSAATGPCIVVEFRKNSLSILQSISSGNVPNIW